MTIAGYFLGQYDFVQRHFEKVVLLIILVSVSPVIYHLLKARFGRTPHAPPTTPL
jgi:membrane-associated protein